MEENWGQILGEFVSGRDEQGAGEDWVSADGLRTILAVRDKNRHADR